MMHVEQAVVTAVVGKKTFWLADIVAMPVITDAGCSRRQVLRVLERLRTEGYLELIDEVRVENVGRNSYGPARRNPKYQVIKDLTFRRSGLKSEGPIATRSAKGPTSGAPLSPRRSMAPGTARSDTCRDKIWRTLRLRRRATKSELVRFTGCQLSSVEEYIRLLRLHGYLRAAGRKIGREKEWVLVREVGVQRPETPEVPTATEDLVDVAAQIERTGMLVSADL